MKKIEINKDLLYELYVSKELSTKDVAAILKVGKNTVNRALQRYDIPLRDKQFAAKMAIPKVIETKKRNNPDGHLNCIECGKEFYICKARIGASDKHFCSISCSSKYYGKLREKTGLNLKCDFCEKDIYVIQHNANKYKRHFCSLECNNNWMATDENKGQKHPQFDRILVKCSYCKKDILKTKSQLKRRNKLHYCNVECMSNHFVGLVAGENHPQFKGGYKGRYYGPNWPQVKREARERDNQTCQRCGITKEELGIALSVHHIIPFRLFKSWKKANSLKNLICLCPTCHGTVEQHGIDFKINKYIVQTTTSCG